MIQLYKYKMTDLLLPKDGKSRKLFLKKHFEHNIVMVEGAAMVQVDFTNCKDLERVY